MDTNKTAVIGGGNMGSSIIRGMINQGKPASDILLVEIFDERREEIKTRYTILTSGEIDSAITEYEVIVIAVKPDDVAAVLEKLSSVVTEKNLLISVAAGVTLSYMETILKKRIPLIRTMPNIAAQVGEAAVALCPNSAVSDSDLRIARMTMEAIGRTIIVGEHHLDAVTGLSGSGPAFIFLMIEAMSDGGVLMGLSRTDAQKLAVQTAYGAASFLRETGINPGSAIEKVTSPGGTTIEGILHLEKSGFKGMIMDAVRKATEKSKSIGEQFFSGK
jgi:pyrroline-5-carboxylate reductase